MKKYNVISLFPEMIEAICSQGVLAQAQKNNLLKVAVVSPRDFTTDVHKTVDDRPFGGGDGMLMMIEPLEKTLQSIENPGRIILLSPQGKRFDDNKAQELAKLQNLTLICGRYSGVDQRFINQYVQEEISIGDYILSGGELAATVIIDACSRFVPGVLGHKNSAKEDSITLGYLESPSFTRPRTWKDFEIPEVLLSGHHINIEEWKFFVGVLVTLKKRPDLMHLKLKDQQKVRLKKFAAELSEKEKVALGLRDFDLKILETL